jgi:outer membrane protein assembly factor BamB
MTGTFDTATNLLYWGVGNPSPNFDGSGRQGDNLYTSSIVALDAVTGALVWFFQFTPHSVWGYDATSTPLLVTTQWQGQSRNLMLQANRNGYFYVLDRGTGKYLSGFPFVKKLTWATGVDSGGRPTVNPAAIPSPSGVTVCPGDLGASNFQSVAYSAATGLFYVQAREGCSIYTLSSPDPSWRAGAEYSGGVTSEAASAARRKHLRAINPVTGSIVWDYPEQGYSLSLGGVLATAGGLVFFGDDMGALSAADSSTGALLWTYAFPSPRSIKGSPMTFELSGKQYVAIAAPSSVLVFSLRSPSNAPVLGCPANGASTGGSYSSSLIASGGKMPYTFSVTTGSLPPGLALNSSTGAITGTPGTGGKYIFSATVLDSFGRTTTSNCGIVLTPLPLLFGCPVNNEEVGALVLDNFNVVGGIPPFTFSISSGALPTGLTLNSSSGVIMGLPLLAGNFSFTGKVVDSTHTAAGTATTNCKLTVAPAIALGCPAVSARVGTEYSSAITAVGGVPPYEFSLSSGPLPPGLLLDDLTGTVSGTPTKIGVYSFTATVEDETGTPVGVASRNCAVTVSR